MVQKGSAPPSSGWLRNSTRPGVLFAAAGAVIVWGYRFPTDRYITPERGLGYLLGIIGGSMMLLLLLYPARKRLRWLSFIGTVKRWFQAHMLLGVLGPICILFHANFSLGATNSNVALWSMIVVAASGLIGRYFYARIHHGLHGRRATHAELTATAQQLRQHNHAGTFLPDLAPRLDAIEAQLLRSAAPWLIRPFLLRWRHWRGTRTMHRYIRSALAVAAQESATLATHRRRLRTTACNYVERRLHAARRVGELESFERLFSWWHVLHLPLFFMLLIAGIVHVIAVHLY